MKFETKNLRLRPLEREDLEIIHNHTSSYTHVSSHFTTKIRSRNYWEKRWDNSGLWDDSYGMLLMETQESDIPFGVIWFFHSLPYAEGLEIGFNYFHPDVSYRDHLTDAVNIFTAYLFETYPIPRIQFNTLVGVSSKSTEIFSERTGFVHEGTMRKAMFVRGELRDLQLFSLLRDDQDGLDAVLTKLAEH